MDFAFQTARQTTENSIFLTVLLLETSAWNWSVRHYPASGFEFNSLSIVLLKRKESCWQSFWAYTLQYGRPKYIPRDILLLSVPLMNFYKIALTQLNKISPWRQLGKTELVLNSGKTYNGQCTAFGNSSGSHLQCMSSTSSTCLALLKTMTSLMSLTDKPPPNSRSAT